MSNSNRASLEQLDMLHAQVATTLKSALEQPYSDEDGNPIPPPAALINVAVNFLKANGITGVAPTQKTAMSFLNDASLPFLENAIRAAADKPLN